MPHGEMLAWEPQGWREAHAPVGVGVATHAAFTVAGRAGY